jgi:hypothetical protein
MAPYLKSGWRGDRCLTHVPVVSGISTQAPDLVVWPIAGSNVHVELSNAAAKHVGPKPWRNMSWLLKRVGYILVVHYILIGILKIGSGFSSGVAKSSVLIVLINFSQGWNCNSFSYSKDTLRTEKVTYIYFFFFYKISGLKIWKISNIDVNILILHKLL